MESKELRHMKRLVLIDGNSLLYRAYYATAYSGNLMKTTKGVTTNALYAFTVMMMRVLEEYSFSHICVAFDAQTPTFRHQVYTGYKAGRRPTPPELIEQFPLSRKLLESLNIPYYELDHYEADDIIGTLAKRAQEEAFDAIDVITGDQDLLQLVSDKVTVHLTKRGLTEIEAFTPEKVKEVYGINPKQVIDLKGLMGDNSDNIPGIPGIGPKTAMKLVAEYGTVENLIAHIDSFSGKLKERLEEHKDLALLSKKLATITQEAPLTIELDELTYRPFHYETILRFFNEYEFHSLIKRLNERFQHEAQAVQTALDYKIVDRNEVGQYLVPDSHLIVEVLGENYHKGKLLGLAIANAKGNLFITRDELLASSALKAFLEAESVKKSIFDYKKAYVVLKKEGITLRGIDFDLLTAAYVLNPSFANPDFRVLTANFDFHDVSYDEEVYGKNRTYHEPSVKELSLHAVKKAVGLMRLKPFVLEKLKELDQLSLYYDIELPLTPVLAEMELEGVTLNTKTLDAISKDFKLRLEQIEAEIYQLAGKAFNIASTKQLGSVLFEDLKLPVIKKTKTGYSTSADVLEKLIDDHPIIEKILIHRMLSKLYSTYVVGLKNEVHEDGRIHTIFNQTLTQTGRLSSTNPNIQNIPVRYEEGRLIRKAFEPNHEENYLLAADYSQIELRVLAHLADADNLIQAFREGDDIHTRTAMDVFGVQKEDVTPLMRRQAKAVNFGIIYGMSAFGLSENLHISQKDAQAFIDKYLTTYPRIAEFMNEMVEQAKEKGYSTTIFNRRRYIEELKNRNYNIRMFGERTAMNAPIQGSAADIIKVAMIKVTDRMKREGLKSKLIIQVHDELIFDVYPEELEIMKRLVKEEMEQAVTLKVPLEVGISYGKTWYDAK